MLKPFRIAVRSLASALLLQACMAGTAQEADPHVEALTLFRDVVEGTIPLAVAADEFERVTKDAFTLPSAARATSIDAALETFRERLLLEDALVCACLFEAPLERPLLALAIDPCPTGPRGPFPRNAVLKLLEIQERVVAEEMTSVHRLSSAASARIRDSLAHDASALRALLSLHQPRPSDAGRKPEYRTMQAGDSYDQTRTAAR